MNRKGTLLLVLALGGLSILGGYFLLIGLVFVAIPVYEAISQNHYLDAGFLVFMYLVFVGLEFLTARKTMRAWKRWRQQRS